MEKTIDVAKIEASFRDILVALGDNPDREGLRDTPARVAKMFAETFEGMRYTNDEIADMFSTTFEDDIFAEESNKGIVVVKDIPIFSYCEHHLALMYNMQVTVAYLPNVKVAGLSKLARVADMVGRRLQLQERIGEEIAEIVQKITESDAVAVLINGEHSCMTARGIKKPGSSTTTITYKGSLLEDDAVFKQEFLTLMK